MVKMPEAVSDDQALTPMQLAAWLIVRMQEGDIAASTYRQYKANLICAFEVIKHKESADAIEHLKETHNSRGAKRVIKKASARKAKNIQRDDLVKLCGWLTSRKGKLNHLASMWLSCTYDTGLRPCEWEHAEIVNLEHLGQEIQALKVVNAKNTNGRSHGKFRHVPLTHLDTYSLDTLKMFLQSLYVEMQMTDFVDIKARVKTTIYRASRLCFTRRKLGVSAYTMRHQFLANAKTMMSPQEAGALAGHAVDDTVTEHYGKARSGIARPGLFALPSEVDRVRVTGKAFGPQTKADDQAHIK